MEFESPFRVILGSESESDLRFPLWHHNVSSPECCILIDDAIIAHLRPVPYADATHERIFSKLPDTDESEFTSLKSSCFCDDKEKEDVVYDE